MKESENDPEVPPLPQHLCGHWVVLRPGTPSSRNPSSTSSPSAPPPSRASQGPLTREQLLATKPRREDYGSHESWLEAYNRWMLTVGRSPILRSKDNPAT